MDFFLRAKHWQIFTLLIIIPSCLQIFLIANKDFDFMLKVLPAVGLIYIVVFFTWLWTIGTRLHSKLPESRRSNLKLFKFLLLVPTIYILGISIYISMRAMGLIVSDNPPLLIMNDIIKEVFPLHILSMFCLFYVLWNNAKTIKSIELQRPVSFGEFTNEFFLLWFFPIGIWIMQPRINKMTEQNP